MKTVRLFIKGVAIGMFTPWRIGKVMDDTVKVLAERREKSDKVNG